MTEGQKQCLRVGEGPVTRAGSPVVCASNGEMGEEAQPGEIN